MFGVWGIPTFCFMGRKTLGIKGVTSVVDVGWLVEGLEFGFRAQGAHRILYRVSDN